MKNIKRFLPYILGRKTHDQNGDPLPPAMPMEGSSAWVLMHPRVDPYLFWHDQSMKHRAKSVRWFALSVFFTTVAILNLAMLVRDVVA